MKRITNGRRTPLLAEHKFHTMNSISIIEIPLRINLIGMILRGFFN